MTTYDEKTLKNLWEGKLTNEELRVIQSQFKDKERFFRFLEYCQNQVNWEEKILLPLQPHLFIVQKPDGARIIKCDCGHEFGDYKKNWNEAVIYSNAFLKAFRFYKNGTTVHKSNRFIKDIKYSIQFSIEQQKVDYNEDN